VAAARRALVPTSELEAAMFHPLIRRTRRLSALLGLALAPLGQAQIVDTLGGNNGASGVGLAKGNSYEIVSATTLIEAEFMLDFTSVQTLRFTVHSSPTEFGTYTEVFQRSAQVTGSGLNYYSSGPISVPLAVGQHYIIAVSWDGSMGYFYGVGNSFAVSFGNHTHGYAVGTNPLGAMFQSNVNDQAIYSQQLTTSMSGGGVGTSYCTANPNSTGQTGLLGGTGSASVAANDLTLVATRLPNSSFGYFLTSTTQAVTPNPGGSQGVLCVGGQIGRYVGPGQIQNSGATGSFSLLLNLNQIPTPAGFVPAVVGETRNFQTWHRDSVAGAATSNFTSGLAVMFL
jgi:hypothetical protein